jgi:hypothetical protein
MDELSAGTKQYMPAAVIGEAVATERSTVGKCVNSQRNVRSIICDVADRLYVSRKCSFWKFYEPNGIALEVSRIEESECFALTFHGSPIMYRVIKMSIQFRIESRRLLTRC